MFESPQIPIILGSSSIYRKQLLAKLLPEFEQISPDIDENPTANETPRQLALRLTQQKAASIAAKLKAPSLIISADQTASVNGKLLNKPEHHQRAVKQLRQCSGQSVFFYTGLCLLNTASNKQYSCTETYEVKFRQLSDVEIQRYLQKEQPYDCAGSFKMEGLGISLFEYIRGDDPNTLIGLPLIKLAAFLRSEGLMMP